jgi:hypothetical protein
MLCGKKMDQRIFFILCLFYALERRSADFARASLKTIRCEALLTIAPVLIAGGGTKS